jgi:hypothetical protein
MATTTNNYSIKQGDAYAVPVSITVDGETVTAESLGLIDTVEFMVGEGIRKVYPGDVTFDYENSVFLVPVTQDETFALEDGDRISFDVRVGFVGGDVIGTKVMQKIKVLDALSEEEI